MTYERLLKVLKNHLDFFFKFTIPLKSVYISLDGGAPLAKLNSQRKRRISQRNVFNKKEKKKKFQT